MSSHYDEIRDEWKSEHFTEFRCKKCGHRGMAHTPLLKARVKAGKPVFCPQGHDARGWGSDFDALKERHTQLIAEAQGLERSLATSKGNYTRLKAKMESGADDATKPSA
jgi:hypothetical protein